MRALFRNILIGLILLAVSACHGRQDDLKHPGTILFLGDSITEEGYFIGEIAEDLKVWYPNQAVRVINRGRGSETVSGLSEVSFPGLRPNIHERLKKELRRFKPDWVVVCYGMNCGIYHPFDEERFLLFQSGMNQLIHDVLASGSRLIIMTPPPYAGKIPAFPDSADESINAKILEEANQRAREKAIRNPSRYGYRTPYIYYDRVLDTYAEWLRSLSDHERVWVVDVRVELQARLNECYDADPIHPNLTGHQIIAGSFMAKWPMIWQETRGTK